MDDKKFERLINGIIILTCIVAVCLTLIFGFSSIFLPSIGSFVQSFWNNTAVEIAGQSNNVNSTSASITSFGKSAWWYILAVWGIVLIIWIFLYIINKRRRNTRISDPPYDL